ncbi:porin [Pseudotabrizicola formosa]|uniref:porin n=1 Tax=Pseudotabrizicola formosa TaxID=2030009 RepID=UPI000CD07A20|nr:porin [Pseudotabrizicola formosa]
MKKVLLATTVLALTAPLAAADGVELSGFGRFGLDYNSDAPAGTPDSQVNMRMRVNIDASKTTDAGVTFGGRIRMQYDDGLTGAQLSPAMLYATYEGLRVEVGNSNTAIDSAALMYNSEIGYLNRSFGNPIGGFYAFSTSPYSADVTTFTVDPITDEVVATTAQGERNRMGIFASYSIAGFNLKASYINPNQTDSTTDAEMSIAADYNFGQFTISAAYADNAGGVDGDTVTYLGAQYALSDIANVGLLYFNSDPEGEADQERVTLYGNYKMDALTLRGYVAHDDAVGNVTDTAFGIGADYDLGGARLGADIHRNYAESTIVGLGVRFDF